MVTDARIAQVVEEPEMRETLDLLVRIARSCTGDEISAEDMKAAWHGYVRWIYRVTGHAGRNAEVRRLRDAAAANDALRHRINGIVGVGQMSSGTARYLQNFLEYGFAADDRYEALSRHRQCLEAVARAAAEAGFPFTALDYVRDCIVKQEEDDPGPERDERYWPEDDPNLWNHEPLPVSFTL